MENGVFHGSPPPPCILSRSGSWGRGPLPFERKYFVFPLFFLKNGTYWGEIYCQMVRAPEAWGGPYHEPPLTSDRRTEPGPSEGRRPSLGAVRPTPSGCRQGRPYHQTVKWAALLQHLAQGLRPGGLQLCPLTGAQPRPLAAGGRHRLRASFVQGRAKPHRLRVHRGHGAGCGSHARTMYTPPAGHASQLGGSSKIWKKNKPSSW